MYNPTMRLLSILELLQSREQISAQELAEILEVEERSIRRYIMMLRDMGIPIDSERGRYGGYSLRPGFRLPPMMFNHDEIVAITVGLMLVSELGAVTALAVESATSKIERVLPDTLWQQSHALRHFLKLAVSWTYPISSQWLLMVNLAAMNRQCLDISYRSAQGQTSQRVISPYGVVLHGRGWYLPAYCHMRQTFRVFRLDRVQHITESGLGYYETDMDITDFVFSTLAQTSGIHTYEIILQAPLNTLLEYIPKSMAILSEDDKGTRMLCYSDDPYWLARYLMTLEIPFTVLQNENLISALRNIAEQVLDSI